MTPIERRVAAAQATLDHFKDRAFVWGQCDCAVLAAFALRQLGHTTPLRSFGIYRTGLGARRALRRRGFEDLADVLDSMGLPQIPPAAALPGDIVGAPGKDAWGTGLAINLGRDRFLSFVEDQDGAPRAKVVTLRQMTRAWSAA